MRALREYPADLWFLTEVHSDWHIEGQSISFSARRPDASPTARMAAISPRWETAPIDHGANPVDGYIAMARVRLPEHRGSALAISSVLPWRGAAPSLRLILGLDAPFAEIFDHVLDHTVGRIRQHRRVGEPVIWGGDFNQALSGRDYVGTSSGRERLREAFESLDLQAPTDGLPAHIDIHPAIDHIAIPKDWIVKVPPSLARPEHATKRLSDHALYRVEVRV